MHNPEEAVSLHSVSSKLFFDSAASHPHGPPLLPLSGEAASIHLLSNTFSLVLSKGDLKESFLHLHNFRRSKVLDIFTIFHDNTKLLSVIMNYWIYQCKHKPVPC